MDELITQCNLIVKYGEICMDKSQPYQVRRAAEWSVIIAAVRAYVLLVEVNFYGCDYIAEQFQKFFEAKLGKLSC